MKRRGIISILMPLVLFIILLFMLIKLYKNSDEESGKGNPISDEWYADPEISFFDGTYWIFPTYSNSFSKQVFFDAFSSRDLVKWHKHERIIDTSVIQWADSALWAPCVVKREKNYFLFFAANDIQTPERKCFDPGKHALNMRGGIGVAVAPSPAGPYKDLLGKPLIGEVYNGAQPIDQFVFEDNGRYYIIYGGWGRCNIAVLKEDFKSLDTFDDGLLIKEITPEGYVEGPVIFKKDDVYYMMWSEGNWGDDSYRVAYGISESITGPFEKQGVVLQSDPVIASGAGHNSVLNIPGTDDWYIVYHRRPYPNKGRDHRVVCIDRMYFDESGKILPVKMTFEGVNPVYTE